MPFCSVGNYVCPSSAAKKFLYAAALLAATVFFASWSYFTLWFYIATFSSKDFSQQTCITRATEIVCQDRFKTNCHIYAQVTFHESGEIERNATAVYPSTPFHGVYLATLTYFSSSSLAFNSSNPCWVFQDYSSGVVQYETYLQNVKNLVWSSYLYGIIQTIIAACTLFGFGFFALKFKREIYFKEHNDPEKGKVDDEEEPKVKTTASRLIFVRKVYLILSAQLLVTFGFICMFLFIEDLNLWLQGKWYIPLVSIFVMFAFLVLLTIYKEETPHNFIFLFVFTVAVSCMISVSVAWSGAAVVLPAFAVTVSIFILLTVFAFQTSIDFTGIGSALFAILWGMIFMGLFGAFWPVGSVMSMMWATLGVILFSIFVVYDTQMLMYTYSESEYILAAVELYLDFINMLLYMMSLFRSSNSN